MSSGDVTDTTNLCSHLNSLQLVPNTYLRAEKWRLKPLRQLNKKNHNCNVPKGRRTGL